MRWRSITLLFGTAAVLIPQPGHAQTADTSQLTQAEKVAIADTIVKLTDTWFAHFSAIPHIKPDSLLASYRAAAENAPNRDAFDRVTHELAATLRNGHTSFDDLYEHQKTGAQLPFAAMYLNGKWVVIRSLHNTLRAGDVIRSINGESVEALYQRQKRYLAASSDREARNYLFNKRTLLPNRLSLTLDDGRNVVVEKGKIDMTVLGSPVTHGYWIEAGRIAYIRVPSFGQPHFERRALEYLREFQSASSIIIDVRGNGGGSSPIALTYALAGRFRWFAIQVRDGTKSEPKTYPTADDTATLTIPRYTGKVALLIDGHCQSACDDFAMPLKVEKRARLFGQTTVGSSGQPKFYQNRERGIFWRVSSRRQYFPDTGAEFEGVGITPHEQIVPTPEDLRTNRDPVLRRAIEWAREF